MNVTNDIDTARFPLNYNFCFFALLLYPSQLPTPQQRPTVVEDGKVGPGVQDVFATVRRVLRQVGWSEGARPQQGPNQAQQKRHEQIHQDELQGRLDCHVAWGCGWTSE